MKRYDYYGNYEHADTGIVKSYKELSILALQQYKELKYLYPYSIFAKGYIRCWIDCNSYIPIDKEMSSNTNTEQKYGHI